MSTEEYKAEKLWPVLIETVHAMPMFPGHKAYTRDTILQEKPETTPQELASRLHIPLGEAIIILDELQGEKK